MNERRASPFDWAKTKLAGLNAIIRTQIVRLKAFCVTSKNRVWDWLKKWPIKHICFCKNACFYIKWVSWCALILFIGAWALATVVNEFKIINIQVPIFTQKLDLFAKSDRPLTAILMAIVWLTKKVEGWILRQDTLDRISRTKKWRVGYPDIDYEPLTKKPKNTANKPTGLFIDIIEKIGKNEAWVVEWIPLQFSEIVSSIKNKKVDCVACIFKTPKRDELCDFVGTILDVDLVGVKRKGDEKVKFISDLQKDDVTVLVCDGEMSHEEAVHTLGIPQKRIKTLTGSPKDFALLLLKEHADVVLFDRLTCDQICDCQKGALEMAFEPFGRAHTGFMIPSDQPIFAEWLDRHVRAVFKVDDNKRKDYKTKGLHLLA